MVLLQEKSGFGLIAKVSHTCSLLKSILQRADLHANDQDMRAALVGGAFTSLMTFR
jgi:hypothetical protein